MPTPEDVRNKLIEIICLVQRESGADEPVLSADSRPLTDVKGFDSPLGVVVTGLLAISLGLDIPLDTNLFADDHKRCLTIEESVALICKVTNSKAVCN